MIEIATIDTAMIEFAASLDALLMLVLEVMFC
jgi:hypothetical protein